MASKLTIKIKSQRNLFRSQSKSINVVFVRISKECFCWIHSTSSCRQHPKLQQPAVALLKTNCTCNQCDRTTGCISSLPPSYARKRNLNNINTIIGRAQTSIRILLNEVKKKNRLQALKQNFAFGQGFAVG